MSYKKDIIILRMYNFDEIIDRRGSNSLKWDTVKEGVIPLWVADMDFPVFPELQEALAQRVSHPFYGYMTPLNDKSPFNQAILQWYNSRYDIKLDHKAVLSGPGTVLSLEMLVREFSNEGEGVLIFTPVYTPFFDVIKKNKRQPVEVFLKPGQNGRFIFDLADIEKTLDGADIPVHLAMFCSPQNPGGRVWEEEEITAFLELTQKRNIIAVFDEIHCDFVYNKNSAGKPQRFFSAAGLAKDNVIVVSGANKTFNLGGLHTSYFVVNNDTLQNTVKKILRRETHQEGDIFAELAVETAYRCGAPWFDELLEYLYDNILAAVDFLNNEVPGIKAFVPDATYLIWADARELAEKTGCSDERKLAVRLENEALVKITPGSIYGKAGKDYVRINAASPRQLLMEGLNRIQDWSKLNCQ